MEGTGGVNKALKTAKKASSSLRSTGAPAGTHGGRSDDETRRRKPDRRIGDNRVRQPDVSACRTPENGGKPVKHFRGIKDRQNTVTHECVSPRINHALRLFYGSSPFSG